MDDLAQNCPICGAALPAEGHRLDESGNIPIRTCPAVAEGTAVLLNPGHPPSVLGDNLR